MPKTAFPSWQARMLPPFEADSIRTPFPTWGDQSIPYDGADEHLSRAKGAAAFLLWSFENCLPPLGVNEPRCASLYRPEVDGLRVILGFIGESIDLAQTAVDDLQEQRLRKRKKSRRKA